VRILEVFNLAGFRFDLAPDAPSMLREASGIVTVILDEEAVRALIYQALKARGRASKAGPIRVVFDGAVQVRNVRPNEDKLSFNWFGRVGDDVFDGHVWTSRPR